MSAGGTCTCRARLELEAVKDIPAWWHFTKLQTTTEGYRRVLLPRGLSLISCSKLNLA